MTRRPCTNTEPARLADALREIDRLRAEVEALKQGMEDCVKQAWKSGYEAGHNHTVEGEWGYAEERAADWFSDSMFSNWTQHLRGEGE